MLKRALLRPPGAKNEREFLALCVQCGQCVAVCPHKSVHLSDGFTKMRHTPKIIPSKIPCYLCMKCPPVCPSGALDTNCTQMQDVRMGHAHIIEKKCHNFNNGIMCWTCYDRCPLQGKAIFLDGGLIPRITKQCVGCGICEYVCPVKAIETIAPNGLAPAGALPFLNLPVKK